MYYYYYYCYYYFILFYVFYSCVQTGCIEGRNDLEMGRRLGHKITAKTRSTAAYVQLQIATM